MQDIASFTTIIGQDRLLEAVPNEILFVEPHRGMAGGRLGLLVENVLEVGRSERPVHTNS